MNKIGGISIKFLAVVSMFSYHVRHHDTMFGGKGSIAVEGQGIVLP
jgi:hypothetical protein